MPFSRSSRGATLLGANGELTIGGVTESLATDAEVSSAISAQGLGTAATHAATDFTARLSVPAVSTAASGTLAVNTITRLDTTAGAFTRTLPSAAAAGVNGTCIVKVTAGTNPVTISRDGSDTVNVTGTSRVVTYPEVAVTLVSDGISNWSVVSTDTPTSALTSTYVPRAALTSRVLWSVDDGKSYSMTIATILESLGHRGTFAIVSSLVDTGGGWLTSAQVLDLHHRGHEIANHSKTHATYTSLTAAQRTTETDDCQTFLTGLLGIAPRTFVYPQGAWSVATDQELQGRFQAWGKTVATATNLPICRPLRGSPEPSIYRIDISDGSAAAISRAENALYHVARLPGTLVAFYMHAIDDTGTITTAQLTALVQLANTLGLSYLLPSQGCGGGDGGLLSNASFERATLDEWFSVVTGAAAAARVAAAPDAGIGGTTVLEQTVANPDSATTTQAVMVEQGVSYTFSGRLQVASGSLVTNDIAVRIKWRDMFGTAISQSLTYPTLAAAGTWARFTVDAVAPVTTYFAYVEVLTSPGTSRSGVAYVDHLDFRPTGQGSLG
jgi:peptidoglycan/xylan/chitin deacetylase (PgdA/CDA1 family)